jgi:hypothetical protein
MQLATPEVLRHMAKKKTTNVTANTNIHAGKGAVISLVISHSESTAQTVTLYDSVIASGSVLGSFKCSPEASPRQIQFPADYYLRFTTGLTVEPGNCIVLVSSIGQ